MPTRKSIALKRRVISKLEEIFHEVTQLPNKFRFTILSVNGRKVYLRVTTEKAGPKYWFDVNSDLYVQRMVDFLLYACGSSERIYVFPIEDFINLISGASVGGVNQVPNFTVLLDTHEFEPAGRSYNRHDIFQYYNNFALIRLVGEQIEDSSLADEAVAEDDLSQSDLAELALEERRRVRYHRRVERNPQLAKAAKRIHGYTCQVCGFNFEEVYGELGSRYIEAHHLISLAELPPNQSVKLSARDDFAVVCSNCHSMIHRGGGSLSLKELRKIIRGAK